MEGMMSKWDSLALSGAHTERHMDALPGGCAEALTVPPDAVEDWMAREGRLAQYGDYSAAQAAEPVAVARGSVLLRDGRGYVEFAHPAPASETPAEGVTEALRGVLWMAEEWFEHGGSSTTLADDYREALDRANEALAARHRPGGRAPRRATGGQ